ncbi:MAG: SGNH/GDSL hydrolase family protein [Pyrinomonadaceae bacterium]
MRAVGYLPYYLDQRAFVPSQNASLLYELRPNFSGLYAGVPIHINSQGIRGREPSMRHDNTAFRVVVAGDSVAFGQGVREEDTLAEQLGARLQRKFSLPVEAVNLGVPGYDTCQEYWRFKEKALPFGPQVALLVYYENDVDPAVFQVKDGSVVSPDIRTGLPGDLLAAARKHSDLYNLVWTRWQVLKQPRFTEDGYRAILTKKFDEGSPGWVRSKACLADLISLARANSIRIIVIPFPVMSGLTEKSYAFAGYIKSVCDAARAEEAECLDVVPALQDPGMRSTVSRVENHPSADVYRRIAELVEKIMPSPKVPEKGKGR